ncbi:hypothetical protein Q3O98_25535 [Ralstonia pseudosolanacearum]|uniref:hypothetical protein n=1 Tax=Ralstonia pseudosolanacearum TaxID=1310165 RepID=UPI002675D3C0|nr:hypothetical protein [Ralstonia pseudosolanacearum]MDO3624439.1 hypothetical protein [Ralstonia pseudosolanacearum]
MALYLLDKNIVEDISGSLRGVSSPGVRIARAIDRKGNMVSPILAIMEGSFRQPQRADETDQSLAEDTQVVGMFYRHARTDANALVDLRMGMSIILGAHWREKITRLMPLTAELQRLLARTYSVVDARGAFQQIVALCRMHAVEFVHPVVTCAVACLYGHDGARKVLKPAQNPTEGDSYNAMADIRMLMETAYIRRLWQQAAPRENVTLYSRDKNLNEFAKAIRIVVDQSTPLSDLNMEVVSFTSTISEALFPNLAAKPKELKRVLTLFREGAEAASRLDLLGAPEV